MTERPYSRRQIPHKVRPALTKFATLIGEVTYSSNFLHAAFFLLFQMLFHSAESEMMQALWHSLRSDDSQRAVLRAALENCKKLPKRHRTALLWAVDRAGKLAEYRNDAIHTIFEYGPGDRERTFTVVYPSDWAAPPKRVEKLERVGYQKLFKALIGDLNGLCDYVGHAGEFLLLYDGFGVPPKDQIGTLPKRPLLQSILLVQRSPPKTNIQKPHRAKRRHQQKSSQPKLT